LNEKEEKKNYIGSEALPTSIKERKAQTHWYYHKYSTNFD